MPNYELVDAAYCVLKDFAAMCHREEICPMPMSLLWSEDFHELCDIVRAHGADIPEADAPYGFVVSPGHKWVDGHNKINPEHPKFVREWLQRAPDMGYSVIAKVNLTFPAGLQHMPDSAIMVYFTTNDQEFFAVAAIRPDGSLAEWDETPAAHAAFRKQYPHLFAGAVETMYPTATTDTKSAGRSGIPKPSLN